MVESIAEFIKEIETEIEEIQTGTLKSETAFRELIQLKLA